MFATKRPTQKACLKNFSNRCENKTIYGKTMEKIRLQKYFTECGVMSRRAAEKAITDGRVKIGERIAVLGDKIDPETDKVFLDGQPVVPQSAGATYIMLNKPMGYVTTMSDEKGRKTAAELVSDAPSRVYPVGRLDMYSEGLLIFTDDGELANRLMHPSHSFSKKYSVKIKGTLTEKDIKNLTSPMELDGYVIRPIEARLSAVGRTDRDGQLYSTVIITLYEGRNRQIRKMCEKCGLSVMRLRRISIGDIQLGDLPLGKWRFLTEDEISYLKDE